MELEEMSADPDFWNDIEKSQKVLQQTKSLKTKVERYENLVSKYEDIQTLIEMGNEEEDISLLDEAKELSEEFKREFDELKISTLLDGEYDRSNAILTLHSGAGGTEACDWVSMLLRMYLRWADNMGFSVEELDYLPGDEAGVKSVTIQVNGENAYGYLKAEKGIHRLVRVSPFDSSGRRHTSFASCDVMPEIDDDIDIEINPDDIRVDTYRASGAGGQHVNKTSSAIRITHNPTGIVVQCQNERSQHSNKDRAMKMLKSKLLELKIEEQMQKLAEIRGDVKEIGWGSQIRSYVFMPYTLVKDHRTGEETGNIASVMDGNIDPFINAYLTWIHS
ncbi:peptide chain release factor 2 [Tyzzerella sp. An114]|nr:peptide chain release factor 2 [Tyzzerella sp. An114]